MSFQSVTPVAGLVEGAYIHIDTSELTTDVEVRIANSGPIAPLYWESYTLGAVYELPSGLSVCPVRVGVRMNGDGEDSDCISVDLVEPVFRDAADEVGLSFTHQAQDATEQSDSGIAAADYDNDGDLDFYIANYSYAGVLYRNNGDTGADGLPDFEDVTSAAGLDLVNFGAHASFVDYDNDGDRDLFIGRVGDDILFQNQLVETGSATFLNVTIEAGLIRQQRGRTTTAAWGDYDNDGDLDLYLGTHWGSEFIGDADGIWWQDYLYRNDAGVFTDVTMLLNGAGEETRLHGYASVWVDFDLDGDVDLLVTSDNVIGTPEQLVGPNVLWRNDGPNESGGWRFINVAPSAGIENSPDAKDQGQNAMGVAIGDVNRDSWPDIAMSNIGPNYLHVHSGTGIGFEDVSDEAGIRRTWLPWEPQTPGSEGTRAWRDMSVTWGTNFLDYDNDGELDLFFAAGTSVPAFHSDRPMPNALFRNEGDGTFEDVTWETGLTDRENSLSSALVDFDRDGFLDLAVSNYNGPFRLFRNQSADLGSVHHRLVVELAGSASNRDAIGSIIRVTTGDGHRQTCFLTSRPSLGAGGELICHFGLGNRTKITEFAIRWPGSTTWSVLEEPPAVDQRITCVEPAFE